MTAYKPTVILALACALLVALPTSTAQMNSTDWQGQDSEFGSIRAPFAATMEGQRVPVEARIVLRDNYESKDSRFFMFGFIVENTPLDITFDSVVRSDTGAELTCYQREGDSKTSIKCHVDLKNMPPAGTEIRMLGSVGASKQGSFNVGAIVVPFTYTWTRVQMTNGLNAELYAYTTINVQECPGKCVGGLSGGGNIGKGVPGLGTAGVAVAATIAVALLAVRRRK